MSEGLEELKRLAYENACCRCQYYIDKKCTNKGECVWKVIKQELEEYESHKVFLDNVKKGKVTYTPRDTWEKERRELKALKIIKECLVSEFKFFEKDGEYFILFYFDEIHELTFKLKNKEEYDLLSEVLL